MPSNCCWLQLHLWLVCLQASFVTSLRDFRCLEMCGWSIWILTRWGTNYDFFLVHYVLMPDNFKMTLISRKWKWTHNFSQLLTPVKFDLTVDAFVVCTDHSSFDSRWAASIASTRRCSADQEFEIGKRQYQGYPDNSPPGQFALDNSPLIFKQLAPCSFIHYRAKLVARYMNLRLNVIQIIFRSFIHYRTNYSSFFYPLPSLKIGGELSGANCPGGELSDIHTKSCVPWLSICVPPLSVC